LATAGLIRVNFFQLAQNFGDCRCRSQQLKTVFRASASKAKSNGIVIVNDGNLDDFIGERLLALDG
jgi:hypothetical protein